MRFDQVQRFILAKKKKFRVRGTLKGHFMLDIKILGVHLIAHFRYIEIQS